MFLISLSTIYTSICVNLLRCGVSPSIKKYALLPSKPSSISLKLYYLHLQHLLEWTMIYINNFELMRNRDYRLKPKLSIFSAVPKPRFFFLLQIGVICGVDHEDLKSINIISKSKEEPPIKYEKNSLEEVGKKFKKNSVALRIVNF
ncbi:hypothetical protein IGI04_007129 [Brassica rapa subsp. trilocularis]|uniref:Uncharacterized protein n=1 Tax=Brassica rapa subsp. trilocularis TaxID=1813537 RepID=A0ABQ7NIU4_BRACM|nr:hypothetical protein IGI04_007129 [Brassica rapa subsp. trilocularis]